MTHWVKALAAKPEDTRNSAPGTHMVERELILQVFLCSPHKSYRTGVPILHTTHKVKK